ncbi:MAG: ECF transporter S component [Acutalibacteraceae bacterium]|jgi:uncharacterized membrane protein
MKKKQIVYLTQLALLSAIVWLMAFTPIGYLRTAGLEITFILIPVIVGGIVLGPAAGTILGLQFGITSFIQCFGISFFGSTLLSINPFLTFLVCIVPRTLMGFLVGVIFRALQRADKSPADILSFSVSSLSGALLNTIFFMSLLVVFFWNTEYIQSICSTLNATNILLFVILFVGVNGAVEAAVCFVLGTAISKALVAANRRLQ